MRCTVSIHLMLLFICFTFAESRITRVVSIHLMLLFIEFNCRKYADTDEFQYISCYSLSVIQDFVKKLNGSFNTSHVTLYLSGSRKSTAEVQVSIHLMLLFIKSWILIPTCAHRFNTSHVTLYLLPQFSPITKFKVSIHLMLLFITYSSLCYML